MSDVTLFKQPAPSISFTVTLTDEDRRAEPNAVAYLMADGYRCAECKAPTGHSRSCIHFDGYSPKEVIEHMEDSET